MVVGVCTIDLSIPACRSLKEKRGALAPVIASLRREFNVSVAEVESHDRWQAAVIGVAAVSTDPGYVHGLFEKLVAHIERTQPHVFVSNWEIEIL
jgi:uncharacterized protein YlxP (DUF503 family)